MSEICTLFQPIKLLIFWILTIRTHIQQNDFKKDRAIAKILQKKYLLFLNVRTAFAGS